MRFPAFLLNDWLMHYQHAEPAVEFDLASSTGPLWSFRELMELSGAADREKLLDSLLEYTLPSGTNALREAIAEMQDAKPEEVQVVTGAAEALLVLFVLAAEDRANVVVPFPGFPPFADLPKGLRIEVRSYRLRPENQYRIDFDEIKKLTDAQTKLIMVNTPHNPTGATVSDEEMRLLDGFAAERGIQLVVDQVYHPIYHGQERGSATRFPHATVVGDFSKALCMPGLRVGWIVERDEARRKQYLNARSYFTVSNTSVGEALAVMAVGHREAVYARVRRITRANVALLDEFFADHGELFAWVRPEGGMTAFPWLRSKEDSRGFCEAAAGEGVLLAPGDCFGAPSHFRLGFGASGERFAEGLKKLSSFVEQYFSRRAAKAG